MSEPDEGDVAVAEPIVTTKTAPKAKTDHSTKTRRPAALQRHHPERRRAHLRIRDRDAGQDLRPLPTVAETLTWRIHNTGRAIVLTTHKELAELKREQVLAYGPDPRMSISKGPIGCYIEPAPTD